ncbi:hypothetical protein [Streptomyces sp. NPDC006285]|uniref:hypothetical protein n=1 Tax=Streptomyces sp. NPDC006285 TaxID=3364742 RepID=UPI0036D0107B
MQRKNARGREEHDVQALLYELYATPPPAFVSRREELAVAARTDGRAEDARLIHAARRPTLAAYAANLLLRSDPAESQRFLELGQALRDAYGTLDADGIKELSGQRGRIVSALSRQAAALARDAGHPLSDTARQDVAATLHAVLADQDAADRWAAGCLTGALTPPADFPSTDAKATGTRRRPAPAPTGRKAAQKAVQRTAQQAARKRTEDELAERRRRRQEQLARARSAAEAADRLLRERHRAQEDADAVLDRAHDRHDRARERVSAAEEQLREANEELQAAEGAQREAEESGRAAADAVAEAERAAHDAAQEVERLAARVR